MTQGLELRGVVDLTPDRLAAISERRRRAAVLRGGAVSPKLSRLLVVAAVAAGFGVLPMQAAFADSGVDVYNPPTGFSNHANISGDCHGSNPADIPKTNIPIGASVNWYIKEGKHNVTPAEDVPGGQRWGQKASADLTPADDARPGRDDDHRQGRQQEGEGFDDDQHGDDGAAADQPPRRRHRPRRDRRDRRPERCRGADVDTPG